MAQIGSLGDIVFTVSADLIQTVNNMTWSGSVRYAEHQRHLTNALTEFTGIDPDKFSFDIYLSDELGSDVMAELVKIWEYERKAKPVPLVMGEKIYGKYRWTIKSHKISMRHYDPLGNVKGANVSIELLEYLNA